MVPKSNMLVLNSKVMVPSSNVMVPNASVDGSYQTEKINEGLPLYKFV